VTATASLPPHYGSAETETVTITKVESGPTKSWGKETVTVTEKEAGPTKSWGKETVTVTEKEAGPTKSWGKETVTVTEHGGPKTVTATAPGITVTESASCATQPSGWGSDEGGAYGQPSKSSGAGVTPEGSWSGHGSGETHSANSYAGGGW
jgi:hypothetical protein